MNPINQTIRYSEITRAGLWENNPALVQLLGLCPLLAVSNSFINALGLGLATTFVLICSNLTVSVFRQWIPADIRVPIFVILIATFVTTVELIMQAIAFSLYETLGIFIPLIVTNCSILGRAEAFASKNPPIAASLDGLMQGIGFSLVLVVLGSLREIIGQGTLFAQMNLLFGASVQTIELKFFSETSSVLLAALPAGAFMMMGLMIALINWIHFKNNKYRSDAK